jgi:hypothetical protein
LTKKYATIHLEAEYLQQIAKERGISRTRLVQVVMEKVVSDALVLDILDEDEIRPEPPQPRYRRFRKDSGTG